MIFSLAHTSDTNRKTFPSKKRKKRTKANCPSCYLPACALLSLPASTHTLLFTASGLSPYITSTGKLALVALGEDGWSCPLLRGKPVPVFKGWSSHAVTTAGQICLQLLGLHFVFHPNTAGGPARELTSVSERSRTQALISDPRAQPLLHWFIMLTLVVCNSCE